MFTLTYYQGSSIPVLMKGKREIWFCVSEWNVILCNSIILLTYSQVFDVFFATLVPWSKASCYSVSQMLKFEGISWPTVWRYLLFLSMFFFLVVLHSKGRNIFLHVHKSIYFIIEGSEVGQACFTFGVFILTVPSYFLLLHMPKNVH